MGSKSLVKNDYFNKLQVNKLNSINNLNENYKKKYLISINAKNAKYENNLLTFNINDFNALIFSDRPYRFAGKVNNNQLNDLFIDNYQNSFKEDKPNVVLTTNDGQAVFEVMEEKYFNNEFIFTLNPLKNDLPNFNGNISLFIDFTKACAIAYIESLAGLGLILVGVIVAAVTAGTAAEIGGVLAFFGLNIFSQEAQYTNNC